MLRRRLLAKLCTIAVIASGFLANVSASAEGQKILLAQNSAAPIEDKWALVIGINEFEDSSVPRLRYAAKDAQDFYNFLITKEHFAPDHVRLLLNDKATRPRILTELGDKFLARVARRNDLVVLYISTHGSSASQDMRGDNFLVAHDTTKDMLYATGIKMQEFMDSIVKERIQSDRVLLVMDTCYSGATDAGAKGNGASGNFDAEKIAQGTGRTVLCSSSPSERSWESRRYPNGIFTKKLIEGFNKGEFTTLEQAFAYAQEEVQNEVREDEGTHQTPRKHSVGEGDQLMIGVLPATMRPLPEAVREELSRLGPDSSHAVLVTRSATKPPAGTTPSTAVATQRTNSATRPGADAPSPHLSQSRPAPTPTLAPTPTPAPASSDTPRLTLGSWAPTPIAMGRSPATSSPSPRAASGLPQTNNRSAGNSLATGKALYRSANRQGAWASLQACINDANPSAEAFYWHGIVARSMEKYDEALRDFDNAISRSPEAAGPYYWRAQVYADQNSNEKALSDLAQVIARRPNFGPAYTLRSDILSRTGASGASDAAQGARLSNDLGDSSYIVPEYGTYMTSLQRQIKKNWFPPAGTESKFCTVRFKVHWNGSVSQLALYQSSGVPIADEAGLAAVKKASPFQELPPGSPGNVDVEFKFAYNVSTR